MSADQPLLDRLAGLPPVPVSDLVAIFERAGLAQDPLLVGLVGEDEEGRPAVHPLVAAVLEHLGQKPDATCYAALVEALTGIWNAAVRGALLLRLQALSPTLGFRTDGGDVARAWMSDPTAQDGALVQQCMVRLLLALRGMAEARARTLTETPPRKEDA
jgi:hypothetical protein